MNGNMLHVRLGASLLLIIAGASHNVFADAVGSHLLDPSAFHSSLRSGGVDVPEFFRARYKKISDGLSHDFKITQSWKEGADVKTKNVDVKAAALKEAWKTIYFNRKSDEVCRTKGHGGEAAFGSFTDSLATELEKVLAEVAAGKSAQIDSDTSHHLLVLVYNYFYEQDRTDLEKIKNAEGDAKVGLQKLYDEKAKPTRDKIRAAFATILKSGIADEAKAKRFDDLTKPFSADEVTKASSALSAKDSLDKEYSTLVSDLANASRLEIAERSDKKFNEFCIADLNPAREAGPVASVSAPSAADEIQPSPESPLETKVPSKPESVASNLPPSITPDEKAPKAKDKISSKKNDSFDDEMLSNLPDFGTAGLQKQMAELQEQRKKMNEALQKILAEREKKTAEEPVAAEKKPKWLDDEDKDKRDSRPRPDQLASKGSPSGGGSPGGGAPEMPDFSKNPVERPQGMDPNMMGNPNQGGMNPLASMMGNNSAPVTAPPAPVLPGPSQYSSPTPFVQAPTNLNGSNGNNAAMSDFLSREAELRQNYAKAYQQLMAQNQGNGGGQRANVFRNFGGPGMGAANGMYPGGNFASANNRGGAAYGPRTSLPGFAYNGGGSAFSSQIRGKGMKQYPLARTPQ